jgi:hypothetical protein
MAMDTGIEVLEAFEVPRILLYLVVAYPWKD